MRATRATSLPTPHNFFSRDGIAPLELLQIGRDQLAPYATVKIRGVAVAQAMRVAEHFAVTLSDDSCHSAARLLLTTGMRDELPPIRGVAELWGKSVVHCPYRLPCNPDNGHRPLYPCPIQND